MRCRMMLPTFIPMGAQSFSGGNQRTEYDFDVMIQGFANGATGLSVFEGASLKFSCP